MYQVYEVSVDKRGSNIHVYLTERNVKASQRGVPRSILGQSM
jgi:hypothetical protein